MLLTANGFNEVLEYAEIGLILNVLFQYFPKTHSMPSVNTPLGVKCRVAFFPLVRLAFFAILYLAHLTAAAQRSFGVLHLLEGDRQVKYTENFATDTLQRLLQRSAHGAYAYNILVFDAPLTPQQRQWLNENNISLLGYLPDYAYEVRMPRNINISALQKTGVKALMQPEGELKKGMSLKALEKNATPQQRLTVSLQLQPGISWNDVSAALSTMGVSLLKADYLNQGLAQVYIPAGNINAVAAQPYVRYMDAGNWEIHPLMQRERGIFGLTQLSNNTVGGRNLKGNGITIGVGDDADPSLHLDLRKNVINRSPAWTGFNHGRLVAGIVGGDGVVDEQYTGVAPDGLLVADYFNNIITKANLYVSDYNMVVTNNSYYQGLANCPGNSEYNALSVYADAQLHQNPYLQHIFAAGNDGSLTCSPYPPSYATIKSGFQVAKNVLDVGNMTYLTGDIFSSSSKGPVKDGRIKPEIIASGRNVAGPVNTSDYTSSTGTSFAAPFVAGVWALLTERYQQLNSSQLPKSGLLKAVLCNSADDKGNAGPDYSWGFGLLNPRKALECIENQRYFSGSIHTGDHHSQTITVPSGTTMVKVMLYWHDKEGSPLSSKALVNDLDLTVEDGTNTYEPWVLNSTPSGVTSPATRGIDRLNNIEQVTFNNPGNSITIHIDGYDIPHGPQEYFVVYEFIGSNIILEYPFGGEKFFPGQTEFIRWSAYDNSSNSFTVELSLDDGATWSVINNNVGSSSYFLGWAVPATPTNKGKIRITRNGGGPSFTMPGNFTILNRPTLSLSSPCEGYADLSWGAVAGATDYEVFQLMNDEWTSLGTTTLTTYRVAGLSPHRSYWFTVRAIINDSLGMRAVAKNITPTATLPCTNTAFDNDLKADTLLAPGNGRENTSTALSNVQTISLRIKNLDNAATTGSYTLSYQVNNGSWVTESSNVMIAAGGTITYHFTATYDFSSPGTYTIRAVVKYPGDTQPVNDTLTTTIVHAPNPPLSLPFTENFEATGNYEFTSNTFAISGANRFDFSTANNNGRLRTFINSQVAINGNRSATLDAKFFNYTLANNSLTGTFNLSNYTGQSGMRLSFKFKNHGQLKLPSTGVWVRGSDSQSWIQVYDLSANQGVPGQTQTVNIHLDDIGQPLTSSFQVRFDQTGLTSANNGSYDVEESEMDDGFSFDDVTIAQVNNDVWVKQIVAPSKHLCQPGQTGITIRVKNTSNTPMNNIPVYYRINHGVPVAGNIASLAAGTEIDYTFPATANLSEVRAYIIDVWSEYANDDYPLNDSIRNYKVYATPTVQQFPYLERFEDSPGGWYTDTLSYSSWRWGMPAKTLMNRAANGNKGWFNTLSSTYKNNEDNYLYSPCFNLSGLTQPVLSFAHIFQQEDNCNCDFHTLEYSTDNGNTWQRLTTSAGINWFDSSNQSWRRNIQRWHVASAELPNATNIRFRFYLSSDEFVAGEGVGIDDIHIFDRATVYTGTNVINLSTTVSGNQWVAFMSGGNLIAEIHPQGQDLGNTELSVYLHTGPVRYTSTQYYLDRNIVIRPTHTPSSPVKVRFYFTDAEATRLITATGCSNCSTIRDAFMAGITQFSGALSQENGTLADNNGGYYAFIPPSQIDVIPFNNGYYAEFQVSSFSEFWINSGGNDLSQPLPVTLIRFDAAKRHPDALLQWQTAAEQNTDVFEVERKTGTASHFIKIGSVKAAGNSTDLRHYRYIDGGIFRQSDVVYYRLKIVDKDGSFSYSPVVVLSEAGNPVFIRNLLQSNNGALIQIQAGNMPQVQQINIRVVSTTGQTVYIQRHPYADVRLQLDHLPPGTYFVEITDASLRQHSRHKIIRQ